MEKKAPLILSFERKRRKEKKKKPSVNRVMRKTSLPMVARRDSF
jgi:hypothetical protein